ncbi:MAG: hypothetical protein R3320_02265 [Nitriliruptorales bacterium]|nr:hypothetical protein [Nitriliruptorales bacterium]
MPDRLIPTIPALLDAIDGLPSLARSRRLAQLEQALSLEADQRVMAMGLLALDLATLDLVTADAT